VARPRKSRSRSPEGRRFPLIAAHLPRETFGVGIGIAIGVDHGNGEARITPKAGSDADSGPENHNFAVALPHLGRHFPESHPSSSMQCLGGKIGSRARKDNNKLRSLRTRGSLNPDRLSRVRVAIPIVAMEFARQAS
jgi:hypothetical protein